MAKEENRAIIVKALQGLGLYCPDLVITDKLVKLLVHNHLIPAQGFTSQHIKNKKNRVKQFTRQYQFCRIDLLAIKYKLQGSAKRIPEGFVYAFKEPAYPEFIKIGSAIDVKRRLGQYQTHNPLRNTYIVEWVYSEDRKALETDIRAAFNHDLANGEWVRADEQAVASYFKGLKKT